MSHDGSRADAATEVRQIAAPDAWARVSRGARLLDVREPHEQALGMAQRAEPWPLSRIERGELPPADPLRDTVIICARGARSLTAALTLGRMGQARLFSVEGGTEAWQHSGLPMSLPQDDADFLERYSRHLRLPQVGLHGQRRLQRSRVVVVGAGGLGSPAAFYLAAAGVGHLRLVDHDRVDRSNLQRQILHTDSGIGQLKVESAARALSGLNPRLQIETVAERVTSENVDRVLAAADVVLDGADNFPLRYLLNDACLRHRVPLVYGAVHRFEGQVSVFDAGRRRGEAPCYRCLFPQPPRPEDAPNCAEAGVLGVLPGVIGLLQANEVLKLLLDIGEPLAGRLLGFDALAARFRETRLRPDPECAVCAPQRGLPQYIDYEHFCGTVRHD